jgi:hypothetical protein
MTATYTPIASDKDRVRFHIADTQVSGETWFSDEEITAIITESGSWQAACVACIENIITRLLQGGDVDADWLKVKPRIAEYERRLASKKASFGISDYNITATARHTYRADSRQTTAPDYVNGTDAGREDDDYPW